MTHPDRAIEAAEEAAFGEMDDRGLFKDVGEDLFDEIKRDVTAAVIAAYEAQRAAEGLVVVPVEPTEAMIEAARNNGFEGNDEHVRPDWSAMLAAAQNGGAKPTHFMPLPAPPRGK